MCACACVYTASRLGTQGIVPVWVQRQSVGRIPSSSRKASPFLSRPCTHCMRPTHTQRIIYVTQSPLIQMLITETLIFDQILGYWGLAKWTIKLTITGPGGKLGMFAGLLLRGLWTPVSFCPGPYICQKCHELLSPLLTASRSASWLLPCAALILKGMSKGKWLRMSGYPNDSSLSRNPASRTLSALWFSGAFQHLFFRMLCWRGGHWDAGKSFH